MNTFKKVLLIFFAVCIVLVFLFYFGLLLTA